LAPVLSTAFGSPRELAMESYQQQPELSRLNDSDEELSVDEEEPEPNSKLPVLLDAHASFMVALVRFKDAELIQKEGKVNLGVMVFTAGFLHILALSLQFYLAVLMYVFVIERREDAFEGSILKVRTELLQHAIMTNTPLNATDGLSSSTLTICWNDHSVAWSQSIILFLWFVKATIEIRDA